MSRLFFLYPVAWADKAEFDLPDLNLSVCGKCFIFLPHGKFVFR